MNIKIGLLLPYYPYIIIIIVQKIVHCEEVVKADWPLGVMHF